MANECDGSDRIVGWMPMLVVPEVSVGVVLVVVVVLVLVVLVVLFLLLGEDM